MEILKNLTDSEYNAIPALRATVLKEMARSPLHANYAENNIKDTTPALLFGRFLHSFLLENGKFKQTHYILGKNLDLRKTADKEEKARLVQEFGENIVDLDTHAKLSAMRQSANNNAAVSAILKSVSDVELVLKWEERGVQCKAKLDAYSKQLKAIIDVKTCQDASKDGFARAINSFSYHLQAAHYLEGARECGLEVDNFIFIAIEKEAPHAAASYSLELGTMGTAQIQREELLKLYAKCKAANYWPSYSDKILPIGLPDWASAKIEQSFLEGNNNL